MKKKIHINSLFVKIFSTVIIGIVCLSVSLSMLNLFISKEVFAESFSDSQQKAFKQIDSDFYDFFFIGYRCCNTCKYKLGSAGISDRGISDAGRRDENYLLYAESYE